MRGSGRALSPYQHFHQAELRAVEQGLPVVRAANTGISAIIDPYGRVVVSLGLEREGVVDGLLPKALPPTPYVRFGRLIEILGLALAFCGWVVSGPIWAATEAALRRKAGFPGSSAPGK